jgi:hypothetical protein
VSLAYSSIGLLLVALVVAGYERLCRCPACPIRYTWSYLACRIGQLVPIWQPLIGHSSFKPAWVLCDS